MKLSTEFLCSMNKSSQFLFFVAIDHAQNTKGVEMQMNNKPVQKNLDSRVNQNNMHSHGLFNIKQSIYNG